MGGRHLRTLASEIFKTKNANNTKCFKTKTFPKLKVMVKWDHLTWLLIQVRPQNSNKSQTTLDPKIQNRLPTEIKNENLFLISLLIFFCILLFYVLCLSLMFCFIYSFLIRQCKLVSRFIEHLLVRRNWFFEYILKILIYVLVRTVYCSYQCIIMYNNYFTLQ